MVYFKYCAQHQQYECTVKTQRKKKQRQEDKKRNINERFSNNTTATIVGDHKRLKTEQQYNTAWMPR